MVRFITVLESSITVQVQVMLNSYRDRFQWSKNYLLETN